MKLFFVGGTGKSVELRLGSYVVPPLLTVECIICHLNLKLWSPLGSALGTGMTMCRLRIINGPGCFQISCLLLIWPK